MDAIVIIAGYLIGSIPFAFIAGRLLKGIDIRKTGDGNVGAANAFREISPFAGIAVMVADVCKGVAAILLAQTFSSPLVVYLAGAAAVIGHAWPVFLGFKGGRGEATASGVLVALLPREMFLLLGVAIIPFIMTRNTMLLGAILFAPLWLTAIIMEASPSLVGYSIGIPCLVGLNHFLTTRHLNSETRNRSRVMR